MQTNGNQNGAAQLSDNLKTFMDNGGHFIGQTFLWSIAPSGFDYTYTPFISGGYQGYNGGNLTLVNSHPVLGGFTYSSIPSSLVNNISTSLQSNSTLIYKFSDNMPLLAVQESGSSRRVGINYWDTLTSDKVSGKMMATSILWCLGLYDVTPTPTPAPTETPTPTSTPINHPYQIQIIGTTDGTGPFFNDLNAACSALDCLTVSSCSAQNTIIGYVDDENLDNIYVSSDSNETVSLLFDGYYIISDGSGLYFLAQFTNSQFVSSVNCTPATATPTPTPEGTPIPTATPTSTPEGAVLTIIVPPGSPSIIFDGETYTSNVSAGVVKNQQYSINLDYGLSDFWYWSGDGINLPAANSKFTIVYVTGSTATLQANFYAAATLAPTETPTPLPTDTPTPTPTPEPATATPTPTTTNTPTPTITVGPLDFTINYDCVMGGRITTSNHGGGSGVIDRSNTLFNTEQEALQETNWFQLSNPNSFVTTNITPPNSSGTRWVSIRDRNNPTDVFAKSINFDCASTPTPTPTPEPTSGPTDTPTPTELPATSTPTPEPTNVATDTPTPTPVSSCSGAPYLLLNSMTLPNSGESLWISNLTPPAASNLANTLAIANSSYFNEVDYDGTDRTSYFGSVVGSSFTMTICQNGNSAIYSGITGAIIYDGELSSYQLVGNKLHLVQSSPVSAFTYNELVYISVTNGSQPTATPVPTGVPTSTPTPTPAPTDTPTSVPTDTPIPATSTPVPTDTPTPTPLAATSTPTPTTAPSGFTINIYESGSDVIWSGSGTFNTDALTFSGTQAITAGANNSQAIFIIGNATPPGDALDIYNGITTYTSSFGSPGFIGGSLIGSGSSFGILTGGSGRSLYVPTGYTSNSFISGSTTWTNSTISGLGLTPGTYTWSWGSGATAGLITMVIGVAVTSTPTPTPGGLTATPTPTPTGGGAGVGEWYFYSDEGTINANIPAANGNTIFTINTGGPTTETFNPNKSGGVTFLHFNVRDSIGTDYTSQFSGYTGGTGTITISQNGDTATYTSTSPGSFFIETNVGVGGSPFFIIAANACTQTKSSNAPFVYADPISITFGS